MLEHVPWDLGETFPERLQSNSRALIAVTPVATLSNFTVVFAKRVLKSFALQRAHQAVLVLGKAFGIQSSRDRAKAAPVFIPTRVKW